LRGLSESWCIRGDGIRIAYVARGIVLDIFLGLIILT
jgi:hypothetical protein